MKETKAERRLALVLDDHPHIRERLRRIHELHDESDAKVEALRQEALATVGNYDKQVKAIWNEVHQYTEQNGKNLPADFSDKKKYSLEMMLPDALFYYEDKDGKTTSNELITLLTKELEKAARK